MASIQPSRSRPAPPGDDMASTRPRRVEYQRFPAGRRVLTAALRVGRRMAPVHGLVTVDTTEALRRLRAMEPRPSFTAYVVACVGRAVAEHPEAHAYRDMRGRLAVARHVDVAILVETPTAAGPVPVGHVIRDADIRDVADISAEIRAVQAGRTTSSSAGLLSRSAVLGRVPGLVTLAMRVMRRSPRAHRMSGTVAVSAIGMFATGGGFGIGLPTFLTLTVTIGGMSDRPGVIDGEIRARSMLDLTITVDHNVVDGAPAARFGATLVRMIEEARLLSP